jgi:hypothetical protein
MPEYSPTQQIIELSLEELKNIMQWVREREKNDETPITILIGGWAVDAYNPWYGSIDLDLVTNHKTREHLKWYLQNQRGFEHLREPGLHSVTKNTPAGKIIIDFLSRETADPFEGRSETLDFHILDDNTEIKTVRDEIPAAVPKRSLLVLFKLKAVWDRTYRLQHNTSEDASWDHAKCIKDCADILALIDPNFGGTDLDLEFLGEQFVRFGFLKDCLRIIPVNNDALAKYRKMDQETARESCNTLLSLISDI